MIGNKGKRRLDNIWQRVHPARGDDGPKV